jgi:hypothetical protein
VRFSPFSFLIKNFQNISNMKLIKEDKSIDLEIQSSQWSDTDLIEFRAIMSQIKAKKHRKRLQIDFVQMVVV